MRVIASVLFLAGIAMAGINIGSAEQSSMDPFCAN